MLTDYQLSCLVSLAEKQNGSHSLLFSDNELIDKEVRESFLPYPHLFVLCCLMDKQVNADKAWKIPFEIVRITGKRTSSELGRISESEYISMFNENNLHRYNNGMAKVFKKGLERINTQYKGDASRIWTGNPHSATVVCRFLEFYGAGVKIATMATNLLHRELGIHYSDYSAVDISPDVHIMRVMKRLGFIPKTASREMAVYAARGINPSYPGVLDLFLWDIGRSVCRPRNCDCSGCKLNELCPKIM